MSAAEQFFVYEFDVVLDDKDPVPFQCIARNWDDALDAAGRALVPPGVKWQVANRHSTEPPWSEFTGP